jgi:hypothetical protein
MALHDIESHIERRHTLFQAVDQLLTRRVSPARFGELLDDDDARHGFVALVHHNLPALVSDVGAACHVAYLVAQTRASGTTAASALEQLILRCHGLVPRGRACPPLRYPEVERATASAKGQGARVTDVRLAGGFACLLPRATPPARAARKVEKKKR